MDETHASRNIIDFVVTMDACNYQVVYTMDHEASQGLVKSVIGY